MTTGPYPLDDRAPITIGKLIALLDVAITRGEKEGYSDDDYRELYTALTGKEWEAEA